MKVLLVGNYLPDAQESMQRFCRMLESGLVSRNIEVSLLCPPTILNRWKYLPSLCRKWLGYVDKFVLFPWTLGRKAGEFDLVHICDQGNAMYLQSVHHGPKLLTCHDLLAVRGALGEDTACPASFTGSLLQHWILRSLKLATVIACDSATTQKDVMRLTGMNSNQQVRLIEIGLNYPYQPLAESERLQRLSQIPNLKIPYILHVGSNEKRKNRAGVLRIFARMQSEFQGYVVFAGQPIDSSLKKLSHNLGISDRVLEVIKPTNQLLEALYNGAFAMLFPSLAEGFGWPVAEAQACGCPVAISNVGPLPEVSGGAAIIHQPDDESSFAQSLITLRDLSKREQLVTKGLDNAQKYKSDKMISDYLSLYRELLGNV